MNVFEEAFADFPDPQRRALERTAAAAMRIVPGAEVCLAWNMPTLRAADSGPYLLSIMGFARHNSLFPHSGAVSSVLGHALADHTVTKGTIHFDRDRPFPSGLLRRILAVRIDEVNESYPRRNGELRVYNRNGSLRSASRVR